MMACRFYRDPLRAEIIFNTTTTYVVVDNTLFSPILMP